MVMHRLAWLIFRRPSVVLFDFDGQETLSYARRTASGNMFAWRYGFGIAKVRLLPDRKCVGCSYVRAWEPAFWCPQFEVTK